MEEGKRKSEGKQGRMKKRREEGRAIGGLEKTAQTLPSTEFCFPQTVRYKYLEKELHISQPGESEVFIASEDLGSECSVLSTGSNTKPLMLTLSV